MADPKRPTTPRPLLNGPPEVEEGYYDLEEHERNQMHVAMIAHEDAVALWYRALTLYRRAALLNWSITKDDIAELVQAQLLGLSASSMKAALDMLMAGYYSLAFGAIRHMLESFVQFVYVIYKPDEARRWSKPESGFVLALSTPGMGVMCETIQAEAEVRGTRLHSLISEIRDSWQLMSKGSHPTGLGILQTEGASEYKHLIGPTYRRDLSLVGFDAGLWAVTHLLPMAIIWAKPEVAKWEQEWKSLDIDFAAWRAAHRAEVRAAIGEASTEPNEASFEPEGVPAANLKDVKRCWRLIRAHEEEMNRIRRPAE